MRSSKLFLSLSLIAFSSLHTVAFAQSSGWLLVANKGDSALGIVDPKAGKQIAAVPEGGVTGHEIIASRDGKLAYVPIYGNSGVGMPGTDGTNMVVINLASRKVVGNLDFGKGVRPHLPILGANGMLYVSTELEKSISIIDPTTLKIVGSVPTGQEQSHMFVLSKDGHRAYTANVGPGTVSVLDMDAHKTIAVIPVSGQVQRIALSTDGKTVFTSDVTKPQLAVIDTTTNKVKSWVPLPGLGYGSATTDDGKWLLLVLPLVNQLAIVDLNALKVARTIDLPTRPQEVLIAPDQTTAYVSCETAGKVAEISVADWKVTRLIDAGSHPDGLAWASAH